MSWTVLGSPLSPFVRKVILAMDLKGIDYDLDYSVSPFHLPEGFEKLNPLKRIPVIKHNDRVLADSSVICNYLEALHPTPSLVPAEPWQAAQVAWFEKFADYELGHLVTLEAFRLLLLYRVMQREVDIEKTRAMLAKKLPPLLNYLDGEIGDKHFLVGEKLSLADLATVCQFMNYRYSGEQLDSDRWPHLARYLEHHLQSEVFAQVLEKQLGLVAKMKARAGIA